jgi:hypothetical protein
MAKAGTCTRGLPYFSHYARTRVHQLAALTPHVGNYACADSESTTKKQTKRFFSGCLFVVRSAT